MTFLIISAMLTIFYVGIAAWRRKSLPNSISAMVFHLPTRWKWVWTAWLALVTTFIAPPLIEVMPPAYFSLAAYSCIICLAMTAAMPLMPGNNDAHCCLAIAAGVLSQICVAFINYYWLLTWLLFLGVCIYSTKKNNQTILDGKGVLLVEAVCWLSLTGSIMFELM